MRTTVCVLVAVCFEESQMSGLRKNYKM